MTKSGRRLPGLSGLPVQTFPLRVLSLFAANQLDGREEAQEAPELGVVGCLGVAVAACPPEEGSPAEASAKEGQPRRSTFTLKTECGSEWLRIFLPLTKLVA